MGLLPLQDDRGKILFDTTQTQEELGWRSSLTNEEMLLRTHRHYHEHRCELNHRRAVSAHRKPDAMRVIRLLKWLS